VPAAVRLYLYENLNPVIAEQLRLRGIDAVSVRDMGLLGDTDANHLARATQMGRVLVASDTDFLRMAGETSEHAGIIFGVQEDHTIGSWVTNLEMICFIYGSVDLINQVEFL
jgi:hypothetical protein